MAELKTKRNDGDVEAFLDAVEHDTRREDAKEVCALMTEITGEQPAMWGDAVVGFGRYDYKYASGREGTFFKVGFSPRKQSLTVYLMDGFERHVDLLERLGPHKIGKACLYITRLQRIDTEVLRSIVERSWTGSAMGERD